MNALVNSINNARDFARLAVASALSAEATEDANAVCDAISVIADTVRPVTQKQLLASVDALSQLNPRGAYVLAGLAKLARPASYLDSVWMNHLAVILTALTEGNHNGTLIDAVEQAAEDTAKRML